MHEHFTVSNILRLAILSALIGVMFMLYRLPREIGLEVPGTCGTNYNPCRIEGSIDLRDSTISDLKNGLKVEIPTPPMPCGQRDTPCFVIMDK